MKILHVIESLSPRCGGTVSVLLALAAEQKRAGHDVRIATTDADHPRGQYHMPGWSVVTREGVPVYYARAGHGRLHLSLAFMQHLKQAISDIDVINIFGLYRFPPTYTAWQARRHGVPYIVRPHGSLDPYLYDKSSSGNVPLKRLYERLFDLPNLRQAGAIHYTSQGERQRASFLGLDAPSFVVPNGLDWPPYASLPPRGAMRERWGVGSAPVVLFLGRVHFKKGLDLLVPAFDTVRRQVPNAQLVIAGPENDAYGEKVRGWVRDRNLCGSVHIVGPLEGADVVQGYVDADVFALPSYTENFGMTVLESMACALPVVISDQVNIHAMVSSANAGLVTRCDAGELATAITSLLQNPDRRDAMGAAGRQLVRTRYAWAEIVEKLTSEYQNVIDSHRTNGPAT